MIKIALAALVLALAPPGPDPERIVYLDSLLKSPKTRQEGFTPYRAADATFGDQRVRHGLMTEVAVHANVQARYSSVSFALDRKYETFEALIGRDNNEATLGQSYCYFEIYADGKKVYSSPALRSPLTDTVADGGAAAKVKTPQNVSLDVRQVDQLKLVVQLPEFRQKGYRIHRACGCVWGEARLTLKPGEKPDAPDALTLDQEARAAMSKAVAQLLKKAPKAAETQRLAVAPMQLDLGAPGGPSLRQHVLTLVRRQPPSVTLLTLLEGADERAFLERFTAEPVLLSRPSGLASAARNVGADLVLVPSLIDEDGWKVELRLLETGDGATVAAAQVRLNRPATPPR